MSSEKGFTLVEVVISALIITIVLVSLIQGMTLAAIGRSLDDQRAQVLGIVKYQMELTLSQGYDSLSQGTVNFIYADEIPNTNLTVAVRVEDVNDPDFVLLYPNPNQNPAVDYRELTITGTWTPPMTGVTERVTLVQYVTPHSNSVWNE